MVQQVEKKTKADKTKGGKDFMTGDPMQTMAFMQQMKMESGDETARIEPGKKSMFGEVPANITGKVINGELSNIAIEVRKGGLRGDVPIQNIAEHCTAKPAAVLVALLFAQLCSYGPIGMGSRRRQIS